MRRTQADRLAKQVRTCADLVIMHRAEEGQAASAQTEMLIAFHVGTAMAHVKRLVRVDPRYSATA